MRSAALLSATATLLATATLNAAEFHNVTCEGTYPHYLQGICH